MSKAKLLQLKLIHIFARAILLMKKLEIEVHFYNISQTIFFRQYLSSLFCLFCFYAIQKSYHF
jgi:hypothetical protein